MRRRPPRSTRTDTRFPHTTLRRSRSAEHSDDMRIPLPQPGQKKCSEFLADIRQRPWHGGNNAGIKTSDMIVEAAVRTACLAETFIRRDQVSEAFLVGDRKSVVSGTRVSVRVGQGGRGTIKKI